MQNDKKPAYITGFLWFAFSGTAMLSAVILPIHIWAIAHGYSMDLHLVVFKLYFALLFIAALYHGLYRSKTILFDLGFTKHQKIIGVICLMLFVIFVLIAAKELLFTSYFGAVLPPKVSP